MQQQSVHTAELAHLAALRGAPLPAGAVAPLALYLTLLCQWNRAMNLVGPHTWQDIFQYLVVDSIHLASFLTSLPLPEHPLTWDLGAGAGLPGVPLRMLWAKGNYFLVEARQKRALFMDNALARLRLPGTHVFCGRAEDFCRGQAVPADCILSRAFKPWPQLLDFTRPWLGPQGRLIILALAPAPDILPPPWRLAKQLSYAAGGKRRWFWALRLAAGEASCAA